MFVDDDSLRRLIRTLRFHLRELLYCYAPSNRYRCALSRVHGQSPFGMGQKNLGNRRKVYSLYIVVEKLSFFDIVFADSFAFLQDEQAAKHDSALAF